MSNHKNYRRGENARTEHGPSYESHNPGKGCNSTHVARARAGWKRIRAKRERHGKWAWIFTKNPKNRIPSPEEADLNPSEED